MKKAILRNIVHIMLALALLMMTLPFYESVGRLLRVHTRAVDWMGVQVLTPTIGPGGVLELLYRGRINKQCPSDVQGFLIEEDGSVPVRFPVVAGGYRPPSDDFEDVRVKIQIPVTSDPGLAPLHPGRYIYRAFATRYCPEGIEQDRDVPDAAFTIRESMSGKVTSNETASMVP